MMTASLIAKFSSHQNYTQLENNVWIFSLQGFLCRRERFQRAAVNHDLNYS